MNRKKNQNTVKTKRVSVRVTEDEFHEFVKKASEKYMTVSDLIRDAVLPHTENVGQKN